MYRNLLAQAEGISPKEPPQSIYRSVSGFYSTEEILTIETEQICAVFDGPMPGSSIINSERYTLDNNQGWENFITQNYELRNTQERRNADPESPEEQVFDLFARVDEENQDGLKGVWIDVPEDSSARWYQSEDGKVRLMQVASRRNPGEYLLFIVLGRIPNTSSSEEKNSGDYLESVLLLRSKKPFQLDAHPEQRQEIEEIRSVALDAYKERMHQGVLEISLPQPWFGDIIAGKAWIERELDENFWEHAPDNFKANAVSYMQEAVKESFLAQCKAHLESIRTVIDFPLEECLQELSVVSNNPGNFNTEISAIIKKYLPTLTPSNKEKKLAIAAAELSIFTSINEKILNAMADKNNTKNPWKIVKDLIEEYENRAASLATNPALKKLEEAVNTTLSYLIFIRRKFENAEEQNIPDHSIVFGEHISHTQITNYHNHEKIIAAVALGTSTQSHAYINAQELRFPLLVDLQPDVAKYISQNSWIAFYGNNLFIAPSEKLLEEKIQIFQTEKEINDVVARQIRQRYEKDFALTANGQPVMLKENAANSANKTHQETYSDSVGLYRMEFELSVRGRILTAKEWLDTFRELLREHPEGITFRTLDEGRDKMPINGLSAYIPSEDLYQYIARSSEAQNAVEEYISAVFQLAQENPNAAIEIIYPMISSRADYNYCHTNFYEKAQQKFPQARVREGAMIETSKAVFSLSPILDAAECINIGSNDLVADVLKKGRSEVSIWDGLQSGCLEAHRQIISAAAAKGKPVDLCGELASNPVIACILLSLGPANLSMTNESIPFVQAAIRHLESNALFPQVKSLVTSGLSGAQLYNAVLDLFQTDADLYKLLKARYSMPE